MTINCPICLDILSTKPFGCIAPCGHYFHQECYNGWEAMSQKNNSRYNSTKCPSCNTVAGGFIRSFLDLEKLGQGLDDISISDSDESSSFSSGNEERGSNDGDASESCNDNDENCDDQQQDGAMSLDNGDNVWNSDKQRQKVNTIRDVILLLDSDNGSDSDHETDYGNSIDVHKTSSSRSRDFQRKVSICSNSPKGSGIRDTKGSSSDADGTNMDRKRLEKKYRRIKKQLSAAKEIVAKSNEERHQQRKLEEKYQDLKKSYKEMERKCLYHLRDNARYEREVRQLTENVEQLRDVTKSLKKRLLKDSAEFEKEKERLKNIAEKIKVGNMQEMKLIIEQNKLLKKQNVEIMQNLTTLSMEKKEIEKSNARFKMKLNAGKREDLTMPSDEKESKPKVTSRSKMIGLFRESMKEAEDTQRQEEEETVILKRQMDRKNMIRKSSTQTSRVLAAVTLQKRVKPMPPMVQGKRYLGKFRKRPASQDLRNMFEKKR